MQNPRRTNEQWSQVITAFERSGLSQSAFARRSGLPLGTLNNRIARHRKAASVRGAMLPVRVVDVGAAEASSPLSAGGGLEILLLRVPLSAAGHVVRDLVAQLRAC